MSKKVAVLLSGCGFLDGAEIHESVLTLLALDQKGVSYTCCAPNAPQPDVVDHLTHKPEPGSRNVLHESARIARGEIKPLTAIRVRDFDGLILPGGYGVARNLCDFASMGANCTVNSDVERLVGEFLDAKKPIGAICIAPVLIARIAGKCGVRATLTIGDDPGTSQAITAMGCTHQNCAVTEIVVDAEHKIVSTPAYMLGPGPAAVFEGIRKCVERVVGMA